MGMIWRGVEGCETERPQVWAGLLWGGNRGLEIGHRLKGKGYGNMKWEAKWKRGLWYPPRKPLPGPMEREPCWRRLLRQEQSRWPRAQVPALTSRLASPLWVSTSSSTGGALTVVDSEVWTADNPGWEKKEEQEERRAEREEQGRELIKHLHILTKFLWWMRRERFQL